MSGIILRKISSFLLHLRNGTAGDRIRELFRLWRNENFWIDYPGWTRSFVHPLFEGVLMRLYRDDRLSELIYKQDYEANERAFVCHYLKSGMIFLDVGANIGLYSLIAAKEVGSDGIVYAFEPATKTYLRLLDNIRLNDFRNIKTKQMALSDQNEFRDLVTYVRMYNGWNSLAGQIVTDQRVRKEHIECVRLDRFIDETSLIGQINLMKIDVEGWEWHVLVGGKNILGAPNAPDILIEFSDANMKVAGTTAYTVYNLLKQYGYTLCKIDAVGKRLITNKFGENHPYDNYFATQKIARVLELTGYTYVNI
jgi:FkbM family methyltransferase